MTNEEQIEFKEKIAESIMPIATNMTIDQIKTIIEAVEKDNPDLPEGFGNMLYEQILIKKYNNLQ